MFNTEVENFYETDAFDRCQFDSSCEFECDIKTFSKSIAKSSWYAFFHVFDLKVLTVQNMMFNVIKKNLYTHLIYLYIFLFSPFSSYEIVMDN